MNDTDVIPVIEGEVDQSGSTDVLPRVQPPAESCHWCKVRLRADGLPPIRVHGRKFHTVCVRAYAADFIDRAVSA